MRIAAEILAALVIALLLRRFVCAFALVKGHSMRETLQNGEIMFVLRYGLFGEPKRFDIVLCRYPKRKGLFVKRIIGLPGETLSMDEDIIYINGSPLDEPFPRRSTVRRVEERVLGSDEYFVMGDNRTGSNDSRSVGPIPRRSLLARSVAVVFPLRRIHRLH